MAYSASPAVAGLESELLPFQGASLWVITIPPTLEWHETNRELNAPGHFQSTHHLCFETNIWDLHL